MDDLKELCVVLLFKEFYKTEDEEEAIRRAVEVYAKICKQVYKK